MSDTIRWGILSTGAIAHAFARALGALPSAELVAVGSRTQASAEAFGREFSVPHCHGSYEALAEDPDIDVVYVATPHAFHAENTILCLKAGKAVLCEKAFAINAREARRMIEVARAERRFLMEAMYTRHLPVIRQVRAWVEQGLIGEVRMVQAHRLSRGTFNPTGRHMNLELGGGSLLDVGIYPLSFATMLLGPEPEAATGYTHLGETGADEHAGMVLKYSGGALAVLSCGLRTKGIDDARIYGTEGMIEIQPPFWGATHAELVLDGKPAESIEIPIESNGLNYEAAEVMRCLREGLVESPVMPLDESLKLMEIMDRLREDWGLKYPNDEG